VKTEKIEADMGDVLGDFMGGGEAAARVARLFARQRVVRF